MMSFKNYIRIELQVFGALPTSSDVCDVDRLLWAGLQALGGIALTHDEITWIFLYIKIL